MKHFYMIKSTFTIILKKDVYLPVLLNFASLNGCLLYVAANGELFCQSLIKTQITIKFCATFT